MSILSNLQVVFIQPRIQKSGGKAVRADIRARLYRGKPAEAVDLAVHVNALRVGDEGGEVAHERVGRLEEPGAIEMDTAGVQTGLLEDFGIRTVPLVPRRDMSELRGTYNTLMLRENYEGKPFRNDYLHITLTDEEDIPNAVSNLRVVYPNLMRLDYDNARTRAGGVIEGADRAEQKPPLTLFGEFYESQNGTPMSEEQQAFADKLIASIWEEER